MLINNYSVEEIADRFYKTDEFGLAAMYLIEGDTQALAIDCGVGVGNYMSVIRALTDKPVILAATSGLLTKVGGRGQFKTLRISRPDAEIVPRAGALARRVYAYYKKVTCGTNLKLTDVHFSKVPREPMTMFLRQGDEIELGGRTVSVIEIPGATEGSLAFLFNEDKIIIAGDGVGRTTNIARRTSETAQVFAESVRRLFDLDWDRLYTGRGDSSITKGDLLTIAGAAELAAAGPGSVLPVPAVKNIDGFRIIYRKDRLN